MTSPATVLLLNPNAGGGAAGTGASELLQRVTAALGPVELIVTDSSEALATAAQQAGRAGAERLVVAGGDGTVNCAINGLAQVPGALARTTLAILPAGTGNDLATALGVPREMEAAIAALAAGRVIDLDLGEMNGHLFANASCGGFFSEVSEQTTIGLKSVAGRFAYVLAGAQVLLSHAPTPTVVRAETRWGPLEWEGAVSLFAVCNGVTVGGGRPLAPGASVADGWLDVLFVHDASTLGLATLLVRMAGGNHLDDERVISFQARSAELRFERETPVNIDGETHAVAHARYRVLPGATRLLVPTEVQAAEPATG